MDRTDERIDGWKGGRHRQIVISMPDPLIKIITVWQYIPIQFTRNLCHIVYHILSITVRISFKIQIRIICSNLISTNCKQKCPCTEQHRHSSKCLRAVFFSKPYNKKCNEYTCNGNQNATIIPLRPVYHMLLIPAPLYHIGEHIKQKQRSCPDSRCRRNRVLFWLFQHFCCSQCQKQNKHVIPSAVCLHSEKHKHVI